MSKLRTNAELETEAQEIAYLAYQRFQEPPSMILEEDKENQFPMFSYNRIPTLIIAGMVVEMMSKGITREEAIEVLQSKQVRWMLDCREDELVSFGRDLAKNFTKMD